MQTMQFAGFVLRLFTLLLPVLEQLVLGGLID